MTLLRSLLIFSPIVGIAVNAALLGGRPFIVKEEVKHPRGWTKHGSPHPDTRLVLRIGLPQPSFHILEEQLYQVSNPNHKNYGQFLSKEEVETLVAPPDESLRKVDEWLTSFGFRDEEISRTAANDWVTVRVPIRIAEQMLDTTYHVWKHDESGDTVIRTTSYSLPAELHDHVDLIQPTTLFSRFKADRSNVFQSDQVAPPVTQTGVLHDATNGITVDASCNQQITVTCIKEIYNAVGYTPSKDIGNSVGITGYLGEVASFADLQAFYADQVPAALNSSFKFTTVNGGPNNQSNPGGEANLDTQMAFGVAFPIPGTFWSTGGEPPFIPDIDETEDDNEPYTTWLDFVLSQRNPPLVISTSYSDDEQTVPKSFALRACRGFAQLGARGVSVLFASGDGGVGDGDPDPATQQCFTNDGRNKTEFIPGFPSSCPFVTTVGATQHFPEVATSRFASGGGFSNLFPRPAYQDKAVSTYLNSLPKGLYSGLFNPEGRAFPDVAAQGDFVRVFFEQQAFLFAGTSCSTPIFAGIVALLNDARLKARLPPMGFLNPFLYSKGIDGLNDITVGSNPGCGTPGFNASIGWDPVTGLGSPNFFKLKDLAT
ncbi:hypothetical protein CVT24_002148 [Panaeolus cyanescens]|uniref:tripeptidyl-peptidase II n=1 Tax=Panaeolus cyanescens TaxID=181874 RepID=A0A409YI72_9AGAR|nr:hypothetical protein CVT24_002148 [Panaeolus cyanescens]